MVSWRLCGLYGEPNRHLRHHTWTLLRTMAGESNLPWCIIGDFNNILSNEDKKGGRPYPSSLLTGFQDTVNDCNLIDLELKGYPYTWERSIGAANAVEIRLDRAMVTQCWLDVFKEVSLTNLGFSSSDHSPLFLLPEFTAATIFSSPFRYENAWHREPLCHQIVSNVWYSNPTVDIMGKIAICGKQLADWGRNLTGNFKSRLKKSKKRIAQYKHSATDFDAENFMVEKNNYFEILAQQELYWKQRSKQFWLHSGDKNNQYFHATASARKRSNHIQQLQDANALLQSILDEEVKVAVFSMHPDKAPGPDGMGPGFFQHHWDIVGSDVTNLVKEFFATEVLPEGLNDTNLVLISKKKNFVTMSDLRPISLCNVLYKIISKVLANRMRDLIDCIISETQSAFIPGRLISDNVMVAFEVMHYLKRKRSGKKGFMAMSKAYDRVEWSFLRAMMARMGFASKWIELIMACVSTVRYRVVHNGHVLDPISPSRGIRQGDPLSTYLFIICVEGLSALIQKFEANRLMQGCKVAQRAPPITHMFFADDSYLFSQATQGAAGSITNMLQLFKNASGQKVNYSKSSIFFSPNTDIATRASICSTLHMSEALEGSFYLGLPNIIGRNKNAVLGFIKNKVISRINSWDGKFLSYAGKEILLKTVIQSLPTYAMSVFLLPIGTCNEIEKLMASFWWKTKSSNGRGIIWMSWERLATPKEEGGMGFRHLHDFNLVMLAKQRWRLLCKPDSLAGKVYKAKYFPHTDFLSSDLGNNPSFVWRSIWGAKDLVKLGASRVIGDGKETTILGFPWLPSSSNRYVTSTHPGLINNTVNSLLQTNTSCWDIEAVRDLFSPKEADLILAIPLGINSRPDSWAWSADHQGTYTVQSFEQLQNTQDNDFICRAATLCWALWKARNNVVWNKLSSTVKEVMSTSSITLEHWRKAQDKSALLSLSFENNDDGAELWTPPVTNNLKINVDATLFPNDNSYGYGLVARDHFGKFIEAKTSQFSGSYPAEVVEDLGIKEALSWIKGKSWDNVELESDSLLSVQAIRSNQKMSSTFGIVIEDCRCWVLCPK
ncbi:uncharacterized protein LOC115696684 [Cannabis sativa]|uniref:uncharacterized protein LOC115696684 n=1 Tax=Cannabis sativa TaxID=3483 RepID=UPI0011E03F7D|nr:uncharacterized protein LOC115696684 [Cannabis sativa]